MSVRWCVCLNSFPSTPSQSRQCHWKTSKKTPQIFGSSSRTAFPFPGSRIAWTNIILIAKTLRVPPLSLLISISSASSSKIRKSSPKKPRICSLDHLPINASFYSRLLQCLLSTGPSNFWPWWVPITPCWWLQWRSWCTADEYSFEDEAEDIASTSYDNSAIADDFNYSNRAVVYQDVLDQPSYVQYCYHSILTSTKLRVCPCAEAW